MVFLDFPRLLRFSHWFLPEINFNNRVLLGYAGLVFYPFTPCIRSNKNGPPCRWSEQHSRTSLFGSCCQAYFGFDPNTSRHEALGYATTEAGTFLCLFLKIIRLFGTEKNLTTRTLTTHSIPKPKTRTACQ